MQYTVVSLFSGLGGLDAGFVQEGFRILWANDISAHAVESYNLNFKEPAVCADITNYPLTAIPRGNVVIGGPPCQPFSLVGKRLSELKMYAVFWCLGL
jgi:DNA (cytosine-5)-methyltransferase 1